MRDNGNDPLVIAGQVFESRLMVGTGKYRDFGVMREAIVASGSPTGSGRGVLTRANLEIIIEEARVPVVVDAGLGVPSEAAASLEMGADAVLVNTALAEARDPARMAAAFRDAVSAGRAAFLAGRMPVRATASPSSPTAGAGRAPDPEVPAER